MSTPYEEQAIEVLREAAKDVRRNGLPCDAAFPARLAAVIREARRDAEQRMALALAQAFVLSLDGDPDILAETLNDHLPPERRVRRPGMTEHRTPA
jgi:hypothetical protein